MSNVPQLTDDVLDERLKRLFVLHQGRENAIQRWSLVTSVYGVGADLPQNDDNLQDRVIRSAVERLRSHGWLILDMNDGHGRYLCTNEEEYHEFRTRYLKPLRARAKTIKEMDKAALLKYPNLLQPSLFDLDELTKVLE